MSTKESKIKATNRFMFDYYFSFSLVLVSYIILIRLFKLTNGEYLNSKKRAMRV